ncbi:MAG TPA: ATP-binding protein [Smithellaceae bacterium]|nr:ATP-binding protein [Smithellaceae bacterium]HOU55518.1 ATP-binding protein [Smithellaceae bacterium]HQH01106.1 ATP-binding protein [Smithellaceae bacterium]HQH04859.1 ATP-binding protein [Smithellaceae bacterium]HQJ76873.1 ATP-binding protein [Smithellaceae bacterium]
MIHPVRTEIRLPSRLAFLPAALNFVRDVARACGLQPEESEFLNLAAEEACSNSIEHAYDPREEGNFRLILEISSGKIIFSVHDQGLPFDYSLAPKYEPPAEADPDKISTRGLGLYLIEKLVDSVEWINHGMAGKELRLIKKRIRQEATEPMPGRDLTPYPEDAPQAPEQTYTVRRMRPEDAIHAARCIYRTYGYSYENETTYFPEELIKQNQSGELLSWVGVDQEGDIVGYIELTHPPGSPTADLSQAVVIPSHRGRSVLNLLGLELYAEAVKMGLAGIYTRLTTVHPFSQKAIGDYAKPCGITLGYVPRVRRYKGLESHEFDERKSLILHYCFLKAPHKTIVHAPPHHREMMERIYRLLGLNVELMETDAGADLSGGMVKVLYNRINGTGTITVEKAGSDSKTEIRRALYDLRDIALAEAIYLLLPLAQAGTPRLCEEAEALGFFFSGVEPCFAPDGDYLRLQYLNTTINFDHIQLYRPFSRELLSYILQEKKRVGA